MSKSSASKEGSLTRDSVVVTVEYHGKTYKTTQYATLASLLVGKNVMLKMVQQGALKCMKEALAESRKAK